ncbi:MAG: hypothetical protein QF464_00325 [Myxococcota bacterium]|nr:hypothetical protein [Myxococcota bacterium]
MACVLQRTFLPLLVATALSACGPTSDKEQALWDTHSQEAKEHGARWAGFSPVLEGLMKRAEPAWKKAVAMADEGERAKAMKTVNKSIARLVARLNEVEHKIEKVKSSVESLKEMDLDKDRAKRQREAVLDARRALEKIEQALGSAKPTSEVGALAALEPVISELITVQADLERTAEQLKARKKDRPSGGKPAKKGGG